MLKYTADHEWLALAGDVATVGITQHAVEQLGDIVFVQLPEVGAMLGITEGTVQIHVKNIFAKLGVNDRTGAVQVAVRRGLIQMR